MHMYKPYDNIEFYDIVLDSLGDPTIDEIMDALEEMAIKHSKADDTNEPPVNDEGNTECDGDCEHCKFNENDEQYDFEWVIHSDDTSEDEYDIHDDPNSFPVHPITPNNDQDEYDAVNHPFHYTSHGLETIEKIEAIIDGLPAKEGALLSNVLKYFDRAGLKDDAAQDLDKANNYAHRLVFGKWRHDHN